MIATSKDPINPDYYKQYPIETIDIMISIFGNEAVAKYCTITAFKYRMRLGLKSDDIKEDMSKEKWYLDKATELSK